MRNIAFILVLALSSLGVSGISQSAAMPLQFQQNQTAQTPAAQTPQMAQKPQQGTDQQLSNDNHYTNSSGNRVHSPAYSNHRIPKGATAQCNDGTYSFSQHRQGTCSHHGGVAKWL